MYSILAGEIAENLNNYVKNRQSTVEFLQGSDPWPSEETPPRKHELRKIVNEYTKADEKFQSPALLMG